MRPSLIAYACSLVVAERLRQINEKGYTPAHDDDHASEELAAAAAFFLLPAGLDFNIAHAVDGDLTMEPLTQFLSTHSFPGLWRADTEITDEATGLEMVARIDILIKGLALGVAELERMLRRARVGVNIHAVADVEGLLASCFRKLADDLDIALRQEGL